jgi:hypothetical protein
VSGRTFVRLRGRDGSADDRIRADQFVAASAPWPEGVSLVDGPWCQCKDCKGQNQPLTEHKLTLQTGHHVYLRNGDWIIRAATLGAVDTVAPDDYFRHTYVEVEWVEGWRRVGT